MYAPMFSITSTNKQRFIQEETTRLVVLAVCTCHGIALNLTGFPLAVSLLLDVVWQYCCHHSIFYSSSSHPSKCTFYGTVYLLLLYGRTKAFPKVHFCQVLVYFTPSFLGRDHSITGFSVYLVFYNF